MTRAGDQLSTDRTLLVASLLINLTLLTAFLSFFQEANSTIKRLNENIESMNYELESLRSEKEYLEMKIENCEMMNESYREQVEYYRAKLKEVIYSRPEVTYRARAEIEVPAVIEGERKGAMISIGVEIIPGEGRVLVQTKPKMGYSFQEMAEVSVEVAEMVTEVSLEGNDVIFYIEGSESIERVDGPSAGAAMAIITIAAIQGKEIREGITITGSLLPNGEIGPVGGLKEKMEIAKASGYHTILLPLNDYVSVVRERERSPLPGVRIKEKFVENIPISEYAREIGINAVFVDNIFQAMSYLIED